MDNIDLPEVPRPQWKRGSKDNGHYNAFNRFLVKFLSFSSSMILDEVNRLCQNFTCLSSMGGGWGETTPTLVPWRQGFRHPTSNEYMG